MLPKNHNTCMINYILLIYQLFHGIYMGYFPDFLAIGIINYTRLFSRMQWVTPRFLGFWKLGMCQLKLISYTLKGLNVTMFAERKNDWVEIVGALQSMCMKASHRVYIKYPHPDKKICSLS